MSRARSQRTITKTGAIDPRGVTRTDVVVESGDDQPDIRPALSQFEWRDWRTQRLNPVTMLREVSAFPANADNLVKTIAISNDQLHNEDPRKFRRDQVRVLREVIEMIDSAPARVPAGQLGTTIDDIQPDLDRMDVLHELAEAIESYLPRDE